MTEQEQSPLPPQPPQPQPPQQSGLSRIVVVIGVIGLVVGLLMQISKGGDPKYLVGGLVIVVLALSGYGGDKLIERWLERNK